MNTASNERLQAIQKELNDMLEVRMGDLLGVVQATEEVTRQLVATEQEIQRQTALKERLETELPSLQTQRKGLQGETQDLQSRIDGLKSKVDHLQALREELMSNLSDLKGELDD
ncbi:MAG TPA: hypothetical protein ENK18_25825 [Deltaproteobacteria bacterium]|nr:hypothetical protein [Deltaproteobacteria bacterium]